MASISPKIPPLDLKTIKISLKLVLSWQCRHAHHHLQTSFCLPEDRVNLEYTGAQAQQRALDSIVAKEESPVGDLAEKWVEIGGNWRLHKEQGLTGNQAFQTLLSYFKFGATVVMDVDTPGMDRSLPKIRNRLITVLKYHQPHIYIRAFGRQLDCYIIEHPSLQDIVPYKGFPFIQLNKQADGNTPIKSIARIYGPVTLDISDPWHQHLVGTIFAQKLDAALVRNLISPMIMGSLIPKWSVEMAFITSDSEDSLLRYYDCLFGLVRLKSDPTTFSHQGQMQSRDDQMDCD